MKAIQYRAYGGYEENRLIELPMPEIGRGEVLVQMRTVGINPLDDTFRSGHSGRRRRSAASPSACSRRRR